MTGANSIQTEQTFVDNLVWRLVSKAVWLGLLVILLVVVVALGTFTTDGLWTARNLKPLGYTLLLSALIVPPMIIVIASGGVDLSVGSVVGVVAAVVASLMARGRSPVIALLIGMSLAVLIGLVNGLLVGLARVHSAVVTLGMATLLHGLVLVITEGRTIAAEPAAFLANLIAPGLVLALLLTVGAIVLTELAPFARKRFLGLRDGMPWLQRLALSGLPYVFSSAMAGLAGLFYLGIVGYGTIAAGTGLEAEVILIVLLGGTAFGGGLINGIGAILAALTVAVARNSMMRSSLPYLWQEVIKGIALLVFGLLCQLYYMILNWAFKRSKSKETPVVIDRE
jgi:ribose/xylose/arabinose/galactoside ABC-type transport system permease subunit